MDPEVKTTLRKLGSAYALAWAATSMGVGPGSAALVALTGNLSHAGLFVALTFLGAACGAALGGRAMDKFGRKPPLVFAYATHAVGFTIAGVGASLSSVPIFVAGTLTFAAAFGVINLTRLSAAEMFVPAERGRGVSWIQLSALFGAVSGPILLTLSEPLGRLLGRAPLQFVWFLAPPLLITASLIASRAREPREIAARVMSGAAKPAGGPAAAAAVTGASTMLIVVGAVTLAASQAAMAAVMGVAGAAVTHAGHGVSVLGGLMFMHFIGMFGCSLFVGRLADRIGRRATMFVGLTLLLSGGLVVATVATPFGFGTGLLLVGLGWSFGFIGATVLLTDVTNPANRAATMGRADLGSQMASATIALGGGWWFAPHGVAGLGIVAIVVALLPTLPLAFLREESPGRYSQRIADASA